MVSDSKLLIAENVEPSIPKRGESTRYIDLLIMLWGGRERTREDTAGLQLDEVLDNSGNKFEVVAFESLKQSLQSLIVFMKHHMNDTVRYCAHRERVCDEY